MVAMLQGSMTKESWFSSWHRQAVPNFYRASGLVLVPTQPPVQWELGLKQPGHDGDHSPSSSAKIKNEWNYTSMPSSMLWGNFTVRGRRRKDKGCTSVYIQPQNFNEKSENLSYSPDNVWDQDLVLDHPGERSMDLWKQGHVAPQVAATELLVAGLAQWVCFECDRWQKKTLLYERWIKWVTWKLSDACKKLG